MNAEADLAAPLRLSGRLHPWTLAFGLFAVARQMLIPLLYWVFSGFGSFGALLVLVFGVPNLLLVIARYWSFRYRVEADELVIEQGIVRRRERHIPLANIQEIRLEQNLVQRWLGVARADVETSTGGGVEASLAVLATADIARLRQSVFGTRASVAPTATPHAATETPLLALRPRELLIAGLTSNSVFTLFVALGALFRFAEEWLPEAGRRAVWRAVIEVTQALGGRSVLATTLTLTFWIGVLLLSSAALSALLSLARLYDFRLTRHGTSLRRTYGLFTRHVSNLSPARIQVITVEQTLLQRLFGWAALRVDVAGVAYERDEEWQGRGLLAPLVRRDAVENLLPCFLEGCALDASAWRSVSPLAFRRGVVRRSIWLLLATAAAFWWWSWSYGWLPLLSFPALVLVSWLDYRAWGYLAAPDYWFVRRGWANRVIYAVPVRNIQTVVVTQTPFDRRLGLATLILDTAGPTPVVIRNVPVADAEALGGRVARAAESWCVSVADPAHPQSP
ncbi:MAG: PH domain-containing protein [Chloracidobacterium sp.]|nr:PH domain-containing protein [Chloracidobacterium sp.]MDW8217939.1 PH domain-containing protein [Acidobacteriota bacterium]